MNKRRIRELKAEGFSHQAAINYIRREKEIQAIEPRVAVCMHGIPTSLGHCAQPMPPPSREERYRKALEEIRRHIAEPCDCADSAERHCADVIAALED